MPSLYVNFTLKKKQSPQIIKRPKARMIIKRNLNVQKNEDMLFLQDNKSVILIGYFVGVT